MALEKEKKTYEEKLSELMGHEGKYVLIHGTKIIDIFKSYEDALKSGYDKFALKPFLVKQIKAIEQVQFISRMVTPCSTACT